MYEDRSAQSNQQTKPYSNLRDTVPQPKEPGLKDRVKELIGYLNEVEGEQATMRRVLCGPVPESGQIGNQSAHDPGIEELLAHACTKAACLAGEAKSLNNRL